MINGSWIIQQLQSSLVTITGPASAAEGIEVAAGSRIQGSPVRAPALPVEGLVVGVALLDPGAGAGGPAARAAPGMRRVP